MAGTASNPSSSNQPRGHVLAGNSEHETTVSRSREASAVADAWTDWYRPEYDDCGYSTQCPYGTECEQNSHWENNTEWENSAACDVSAFHAWQYTAELATSSAVADINTAELATSSAVADSSYYANQALRVWQGAAATPMQTCSGHTDRYTHIATQEDFLHLSSNSEISSAEDYECYKWASRLRSMNIPISLLPAEKTNCVIDIMLVDRARKGIFFSLDWHQGGKYNSYAYTSVICRNCSAKLVIQHPGLPAKQNELANPETIARTNEMLVRFFLG